MAFDPNSPATNHAGETDVDQIRENFSQLRKLEYGASDPPNPVAGMLQVYSGGTNPVLRQRNKDNNGWINIYDLVTQRLMVDAHTIDGLTVSELGPQAGSVGTSQLRTASGSVSGGGNKVLPGGQYSFYPQISGADQVTGYVGFGYSNAGYATILYIQANTGTPYARNRYVTASGTEYWLFLLIDTDSDNILGGYGAADHPCYGNGGDPDEVPHPFAEYWGHELPENLEIVLLDMATSRAILAEATDRQSPLDLLHTGVWRVDRDLELPFAPRDIDGHSILQSKHASYKVRRAVKA